MNEKPHNQPKHPEDAYLEARFIRFLNFNHPGHATRSGRRFGTLKSRLREAYEAGWKDHQEVTNPHS